MSNLPEIKNINENDKSFKIKAAVFLTGIAGVSMVAGFSKTIMSAKKHDPSVFEKAQAGNIALLEGGSKLAVRALAWGTFYSVLGTGSICYAIWKLSGASNMIEFRQKMSSIFPKVKRNEIPQSRTEFDGLTDLMKYLSSWGKE